MCIRDRDDCDSEKLLSMFRRFWTVREENRETIAAQYPLVREKVLETGRVLYGAK